MGNYTQEISKEDNDLRLSFIELSDGVCPICKVNTVEEFYSDVRLNVGRYIYYCKECGVVVREEVDALEHYRQERYIESQRRMFDLIVAALYK